MRPRFSLRTLLILTALVAAGCYWWIARPTIVASSFVATINQDVDYRVADALCAEGSTVSTHISVWHNFRMGNPLDPSKTEVTAILLSRTLDDLLRGQRRVWVTATNNQLVCSLPYTAASRRMKHGPYDIYECPADISFPSFPLLQSAVGQ